MILLYNLKNIFNARIEEFRDLEGQGQGRYVFVLLKRQDGLTGTAHLFRELLLGHFIVIKTKSADPVFDLRLLHVRSSDGP